MDTTHCTIDGWVDALHAPDPHGTAMFGLTVCPADADTLPEDAPDTVVSCTSTAAGIVHELLTRIQPGDLLRVTGTLDQPSVPSGPTRLTVDVLQVLDAAPMLVLSDMVIDRYGDYCVIFDADIDTVPVFTACGMWVGLADNPDTITTLIDTHERVHGGDA
ncbi:hypothetical protein [Streptomyces subrutilus]|uniref:hypothetical protein n=1 Tax=Streptomyces subrutilus TaxID=36818 RepID=UPI002E13C155|nr:hypothetical protein OG479_34640 [Streptomyces subrutilus]